MACFTFLRAMDVMVTTGAVRREKLQPKCHHQQTNTQFFYRPDALPLAQPTASEQTTLTDNNRH